MNSRGKERIARRLAAILAADVVGYSRLIGEDEEGTLDRLKTVRIELIDPKISEHHGRVVKVTGDGLLAEFASVIDALRCAADVQRAVTERNTATPPRQRLEFRIGIHQGDIVVEDGDIFGDGVNVAARLEGLAEPSGICVSGRVQEDAAGRVDLDFEDLGDRQLKNIIRPVRVYRVRLQRSLVSASAQLPPPFPDKPSIAVLPFANASGDAEQDYFADGMGDEIIAALSRIRSLLVIARSSTFSYKGQAADARQIGRDLGVHYVLEGSVRKSGGRVRIGVQLIEADTDLHLWADHFDGSIDDIFELQDRVAISVAGVIEPTLRAAETRKANTRPTADTTAYDLYLRALSKFYALTKEGIAQALELFQQAVARDPHYGPALAWAAMCHLWRHLEGWDDEPEAARLEGMKLARLALEVAGDDPSVLANAALALAQFGEDIGAMMILVDRSLALDPSSARAWYVSGLLRLWSGRPDLAIEHVENSLRLSPRERLGAHLSVIGTAHMLRREFDHAIAKLLVAIHERPTNPPPYRALACCYAHLGRLDEARQTIERLRAVTSSVVPTVTPFRNPEHRELFLSGLRAAAGEAT